MPAIKNDQISIQYYFKKIIKRPGSKFQSPELSRKYVQNVCHTVHQYLAKSHFDSSQDSKEISMRVTLLCSNVYDDVTDFEICAFHRNTKTQISRERNIIFSSNKKVINCISRVTLLQKIVLEQSSPLSYTKHQL